MWIIPTNHPLYSAFAPEYLDSKEALQELSGASVSLPTWKSKPSVLQTWLRAWKRVYWIQPLFGRMLKPSMHDRFVERYTASLEDIHASHSANPGSRRGRRTLDTCGRTLSPPWLQPDLFGHSSKMSPGTLPAGSKPSATAFKEWVTGLRREYTQRERLALRMKGGGCSSLRSWPTPSANEDSYRLNGNSQQSNSLGGLLRKEALSMNGKSREQLNPAWVAQLMGTTAGTTFFVPLVTQSWSRPPK